MRRLTMQACLFLLCACVSGQIVRTDIASQLDWALGLRLACSVEAGDLAVKCLLPGDTLAPVLALTAGQIQVGPMDCKGLLWQLNHPLAVASDAPSFCQPAGLHLDCDSSGHMGISCLPVADVGLFALSLPDSSWEYGCYARPVSSAWLFVEGAGWMSQPEPTSPGSAWFLSRAPYPGGALLGSAVQFRIGEPRVNVSCTFGSSAGERVPGGGFWHLRAAVSDPCVDAGLLVGGASGSYTPPDGLAALSQELLSTHCAIALPGVDMETRYSMAFMNPPCFWGPFLASRQRVRIGLDRRLSLGGKASLGLGLAGEKRIVRAVDGGAEETASSNFAAEIHDGPLQAEVRVLCTSSGGPGLDAVMEWSPLPSLVVSAKGAISWPGLGMPSATLSIQAKHSVRGSTFSVEAGCKELPAACAPSEVAKHLVVTIKWDTSETVTIPEEESGFAP